MYATSPDRYKFIIDNYKKRLDKDPNNVEIKKTMDFFEECAKQDQLDIPKENDMEYDLRKCEWIVKKCKSSEIYSQNLYAAICNNSFFKNSQEWGCSWRHSAGIISNLREQGDYIDWYCSGADQTNGSVEEGTVTKEIEEDLNKLGWVVGK